jgi:hypothetical protein
LDISRAVLTGDHQVQRRHHRVQGKVEGGDFQGGEVFRAHFEKMIDTPRARLQKQTTDKVALTATGPAGSFVRATQALYSTGF